MCYLHRPKLLLAWSYAIRKPFYIKIVNFILTSSIGTDGAQTGMRTQATPQRHTMREKTSSMTQPKPNEYRPKNVNLPNFNQFTFPFETRETSSSQILQSQMNFPVEDCVGIYPMYC